jgi:uncharacterized protein YciW
MRVYLICTRRRGRPKVALEVCKACGHNRACRQYLTYRNPPLFPDGGKPQGNAIS